MRTRATTLLLTTGTCRRWHRMRLGDICLRISNGTSLMQNPQPIGLPVTRIETISAGIVDSSRVGYLDLPERVIEPYTLRYGDILFSHINSVERLGNCAIYEGQPAKLIHGMNLLRLQIDTEIANPYFVLNFLKSAHAKRFYERNARRAIGQASLNINDLSGLEVPLPLFDKQTDIVTALSKQMGIVENARLATKDQLGAAKALAAAYLSQTFDSDEARACRTAELGDLCSVKGGKRLPPGTDFATMKTKFPYIRVVDFRGMSVNGDSLKYIDEETHQQIARYTISIYDVYISIAGSIGIVGTIPDDLDGANLTENAAKLVIRDKTVLNRDFLAVYLRSKQGIEAIKQRTNFVGQPKLALERIATIRIPLPSFERQQAIAATVMRHLQQCADLDLMITDQLKAINGFPNALLANAFNDLLISENGSSS
jgi:type I restriction enzyme, S subunit